MCAPASHLFKSLNGPTITEGTCTKPLSFSEIQSLDKHYKAKAIEKVTFSWFNLKVNLESTAFSCNWLKSQLKLPYHIKNKGHSTLTYAMTNSTKIHVLNDVKLYLSLLQAYNAENFHYRSPRHMLTSILHAFYATLMILLLFVLIVLCTWYMVERGANLIKIIVSLPMLLGILQMLITFIALLTNNRIVTETINRVQNSVDQRKLVSFGKFYVNSSWEYLFFFLPFYPFCPSILTRMCRLNTIASNIQARWELPFAIRHFYLENVYVGSGGFILDIGDATDFVCNF